MTLEFHLARHALHAESGIRLTGRQPISLSQAGRDQARCLAYAFRPMNVARIDTSPSPRAMETAAILAESMGCAIRACHEIDEIDFGTWTGRTFKSLEGDPDWVLWNARRGAAAPPGGESIHDVAARASRYLRALGTDPSEVVLAISHGDVIRTLVAIVLGLDLGNVLRFEADEASVTSFRLGEGGAVLSRLNWRPA